VPEPEDLIEAAANRKDARLALAVALVALAAVLGASLLIVTAGTIY